MDWLSNELAKKNPAFDPLGIKIKKTGRVKAHTRKKAHPKEPATLPIQSTETQRKRGPAPPERFPPLRPCKRSKLPSHRKKQWYTPRKANKISNRKNRIQKKNLAFLVRN